LAGLSVRKLLGRVGRHFVAGIIRGDRDMNTVASHSSWTQDSAAFPESHDWQYMNSPKTYKAVLAIVEAINEDFKTADRNLVPGLREALRLIAQTTESLD
jgi:hypothetical protein